MLRYTYIARRGTVRQPGRLLDFFSVTLPTSQSQPCSSCMLFRLHFHLLRGPFGCLLPVKSGLTVLHPPLALSSYLHLYRIFLAPLSGLNPDPSTARWHSTSCIPQTPAQVRTWYRLLFLSTGGVWVWAGRGDNIGLCTAGRVASSAAMQLQAGSTFSLTTNTLYNGCWWRPYFETRPDIALFVSTFNK